MTSLLRKPWLLLLSCSLLLAGCATPGAEIDAGVVAEEGLVEDAGSEGASPPEGDGGDAGDTTPSERWHGFTFDEPVTPRSGEAGFVKSFTARISEEDDGEVKTFDMQVDVVGTSTMDIRTKRMSFADGFSEEVVTTPVEVTEYKHTVTVVRDDTGELEEGAVSVVHGFAPTGDAPEGATWLLGYARMAWTNADGTSGLTEYFVTPEQQNEDGAAYLPYQEGEGDFSAHWGHSLFVMAYNPMWLSGWADGSQEFEEGSWSFAGQSYTGERKTLTVDGYTFDGWRVAWAASSADSTATWSFEVAPALPIPFSYSYGGSDGGSGGSSSHWTYELRALRLG